jgi:purine-binding chemotaxis protein CheW
MAKKKLLTFSADDASDVFTPTVKTFVSAEAPPPLAVPKPSSQSAAFPQSGKQTGSPEGASAPPSDSPQASQPVVQEKPAPPAEKKAVPEKAPETARVVPPHAAAETGKVPEPGPEVTKKQQRSDSLKPQKAPERIQEPKDKNSKAAVQTTTELVGFILGNEEYAIEINKVQDINRMVEITRVPKTPDFVQGVMNLRGKVIPVIHLRKRFHLPDKPFDRNSRIVVVEVAGSIMGFIVDSITEVIRIPAGAIEQVPDLVSGIDSEYIMGVGKLKNRLLILIDLGKMLAKKTSS